MAQIQRDYVGFLHMPLDVFHFLVQHYVRSGYDEGAAFAVSFIDSHMVFHVDALGL